MARTTMANLITLMRGRINAGTTDYTIGTANYWDADQIEGILDQHRLDIWHETVEPIRTYDSGTVWYVEYPLPWTFLEATDAGTAIFYVEAGDNTQIGTANWSIDYDRGHVTFTADQKGSAYYFTARSYDLDGAAAEIWRHKAARFAESFDFSTDNMRVAHSQKMKHALDMADYYDKKSQRGGFTVTTVYRSDVDVNA